MLLSSHDSDTNTSILKAIHLCYS